ncbi:AzlD family protein [Aquabacter spiritensis]|uniref:Putative membrane protein n=1 Tax=Aquabacter spiritensis TaxID=933073 RepID=A0A4R3M5J7_9HYPH|nr:AzlD domain-containing protein [Aquabacter spiritensis]TCT06727.1 putative membrane protein [Aquabacter spiritensis]
MNSVDAGTLAGIAVMAVTTLFNRTAGFVLMRFVPLTPRVRRILECLPGAVLIAIIAPAAAHGDLAMILGLAAALLAAKFLKSDFFAVLAAVVVGATVRYFGY